MQNSSLKVHTVEVKNVLTRTSGYLESVATHSLQPYRGCTFGNSLCGVGCYVQHNPFVTRGRQWGRFLEVRVNAAQSYLATVSRERRYCERKKQDFAIFMSSSTDPFVPQERRYRITESLLKAMLVESPDCLILQTHTAAVTDQVDLFCLLSSHCRLRVHISIETDRDSLPGLPPPASPVRARIEAAGILKANGITTVITVAPLLPINDPASFFEELKTVSDALVLDHFVGGDGTADGRRTRKTALPESMEGAHQGSSQISYLEEMLAVAKVHYQGPIGIGQDGFAARYSV